MSDRGDEDVCPTTERYAIVAGVTFPLEALSVAVTARAEIWSRLAMSWRMRPVHPNHGKPVVGVGLDSAKWLVDITIWSTGEAELGTIRLTDDRTVNKYYELACRDDLEALLDELIELIVHNRLPSAAVAGRPGIQL